MRILTLLKIGLFCAVYMTQLNADVQDKLSVCIDKDMYGYSKVISSVGVAGYASVNEDYSKRENCKCATLEAQAYIAGEGYDYSSSQGCVLVKNGNYYKSSVFVIH